MFMVSGMEFTNDECYANVGRMVAFASLAFGLVGVIACACCKDVDKKMNNKVRQFNEGDKG